MDYNKYKKCILLEIASLPPMRIQKIWLIKSSAYVFELYCTNLKRLYLIADCGRDSASLHVQKNKPTGIKATSTLLLALKKHASFKRINFFLDNEEENLIIAELGNGSAFILFKINQTLTLSLFNHNKLLSSTNPFAKKSLHLNAAKENHTGSHLHINFSWAEVYFKKKAHHQYEQLRQQYIKQEKAKLRKLKKLLKNLQNDLKNFENSLLLEKIAELLKNNLHEAKKNQDWIWVADYEATPPQKKPLNIPKGYSPKLYLEKLFNKIKRAKRGIKIVLPRIEKVKQEINDQIFSLSSIDSKKFSSFDTKVDKKNSPTKKAFSQKRLPYRQYFSRADKIIWVGRSAKDSDDMTFHHAKGNHWWFHARDYKGAHVIVKSSILDDKTLIDAATLAAFFSKTKNEPKPTIQYTQVKNLRKPKGFALGLVLVKKEKTIEIKTEKDLLKWLLDNQKF